MMTDGPAVCVHLRSAPSFRSLNHRNRWRAGAIITALMVLTSFIGIVASGQLAYTMQLSPGNGNNRFGTVNLLTGSFTRLGNEGKTVFNDFADLANGTLYAIADASSLVTLNTNTGAIVSRLNFNVPGITSLALAPDGTLYGATAGALYTINPVNGIATLVGTFNNSAIGNSVLSIRFGYDGMLYDTATAANAADTLLFQINTTTGAATLMGTVPGFAGLVLANAGPQMYALGVPSGATPTGTQTLVGIDLNTLVPGGLKADGSTAYLGYELLNANFASNVNFSSANLFIVPGSVLPVPEPGALVLSVTGGVLLLLVSRKRRHY